jgi:hypothetical protein
MQLPTIGEVLKDFSIPLKIGTQSCPFCGKAKKFQVTDNYFKCYGCNNAGDLPKLLVDLKICSTRSKAYSLVLKNSSRWFLEKERRLKTLNSAWSIYKENGLKPENQRLIKEWADSRSLSTLKDIEYGYANRTGLEKYIKAEDLLQAGLVTKSRRSLFENRIVFTIRDPKGELAHFQSRSLNSKEDLRWIASAGGSFPSISSYLFNYSRAASNGSGVIVAEGITDCLSLNEMSLSHVGTFGIEIQFTRFLELFSSKKQIVLFYDNNKYGLGTAKAGQYKSWIPVLKSFSKLYKLLPKDVRVSCLTPPTSIGDDINDWLTNSQNPLTKKKCIEEINNAPSIEEFCMMHLSAHKELHRILVEILGVRLKEENIRQLESVIPYRELLAIQCNSI